MKILIVAGGTGGHLFPAVRLAEELLERRLADVLFISSYNRQDRDILKLKNIPIRSVPLIGFQSRDALYILNFAVCLIAGTIKSLFLLLQFRPQVVIGFGGYVSGPILLLAALFRVHTIIHEQNVYPGKTNRILAGFVDRIALNFPESIKYLKRFEPKLIVSGNPLRRGLNRIEKRGDDFTPLDNKHPTGFTILAMGGSQGASILNRLIPEAVGLIPEDKRRGLEVIHISGHKEKDVVMSSYRNKGVKNRVFSFTLDIDKLYNESDFVISRAGATTISELLYLAKPAILIPYPYAGGHQLLNARVLEKIGVGVVLQEKGISANSLRDAIVKFMNKDALTEMSQKLKNDNKDACSILVNEIFKRTQ